MLASPTIASRNIAHTLGPAFLVKDAHPAADDSSGAGQAFQPFADPFAPQENETTTLF